MELNKTVDMVPVRKTRSDATGRAPRTLSRPYVYREREYRAAATRWDKAVVDAKRSRPFVGWDGEGYTDSHGIHHYALFGNSNGLRKQGANLDWRQCLPLLFQTPPDAINVVYSGLYDTIMLFKSEPKVAALLKGKRIFLDQYSIQYYRSKYLRVTNRELKQTRTLYDVFTFFGSSFVKACQQYIGQSETLAEIEAMKLLRNTFTATDIKAGNVGNYMTQELQLLVELCTELRSRLAAVDIHPMQWHGPGAVAGTVLRRERILPHKGTYDAPFRRTAESAYYGGRFEQFKRGTYDGTVWQYDIRSAYPDAMRYLPSLAGAAWHHRHGIPDTITKYGLYHVDAGRQYDRIGHLPWRNVKGSIYYPIHFLQGWYWGIELPDHLTTCIDQYYTPYGIDSSRPFAFIESMYEQRAQLKRDGLPQQIAVKLALNSLYGKVAQSKGARQAEDGTWKYPAFHEVVWAGLITAYTRRKMSDAIRLANPYSVIAIETDSIFTTEPLPLPVGEGLGEWELTILEGIKYIQSGVSLIKLDDVWQFKSRGFAVKQADREVEIWSNFLAMPEPKLTFRQQRFVTNPAQKLFARWYELEHTLTLNELGADKRLHRAAHCTTCQTDTRWYDAALHDLHGPEMQPAESTPYGFVWNDDDASDFATLHQEALREGGREIKLHLEYVTNGEGTL